MLMFRVEIHSSKYCNPRVYWKECQSWSNQNNSNVFYIKEDSKQGIEYCGRQNNGTPNKTTV
jgi:hypothetical protein